MVLQRQRLSVVNIEHI